MDDTEASFLSYNGQIFLTSFYLNVTALRNHVTFMKITSPLPPSILKDSDASLCCLKSITSHLLPHVSAFLSVNHRCEDFASSTRKLPRFSQSLSRVYHVRMLFFKIVFVSSIKRFCKEEVISGDFRGVAC